MKIIVSKSSLEDAVKNLCKVINPKNALPILGDILFDVNEKAKIAKLTCSRQTVGLILTKIVGGRPVTNITFTCKRMLRTYRNRGDFWYYDKAPEAVKLMVNRIDMSALADLYKVTKDRRI